MSVKVSLRKGQTVSLRKNLNNVLVGLGWDTNEYGGRYSFDLDASVFLLGKDNKVIEPEDFIFYENLEHPTGSVIHTGDNRTGDGDGDDEAIKLDLGLVPSDIHKIVVAVTIYESKKRAQNFGQVENAYIRLVDESTGDEVLRYDLSEDYSTETVLIFAELYREGRGWNFEAKGDAQKGEAFTGDLIDLCDKYGIDATY